MISITSRPSWNIKGITTSICIPINLFTRIQHHFTHLKPRSVSLSHTMMLWSLFITANKTKQTKNKNKDAPRKAHITWSNKNIAHWKMPWCFLMMNRGCLGHPQALTLEPLEYFLGCPGDIPKLELLSILHPMASFFSPYTWKLPSPKTHQNSLLATLVQSKQ